ncbi:MAG: hypothetical protein RR205_01055 [Oscillospiraceae bacterium]
MDFELKGYKDSFVTFQVTPTTAVGYPVKVSGEYAVTAAATGEDFVGILKSKNNTAGLVQTDGFAVLYCSDTTMPTYGRTAFVADGTGGVKAGANGRMMTVVGKDATNKLIKVII